jgi:hypothetical protein
MKKDAYYFSHDCNARKDEKVLTLLAEHGYEGYGLYWCLVEMMFENQDTAISRKLLKGIAYDLRVDITLLQKVITTCYNTSLFQADKEKIWSNSLRRRKAEWLEKKNKLSFAGKRGMESRWHSDNNVIKKDNEVITPTNTVITPDNIVITKERKGKKRKVIFIPPKLDDVIEYFKEGGYPESLAKEAFDYYNVAEWHDSKGQPVINWKQKMIGVWFKDENKLAPVKKLQQFERSGPPLKKLIP